MLDGGTWFGLLMDGFIDGFINGLLGLELGF
jgi:hypothetical protein